MKTDDTLSLLVGVLTRNPQTAELTEQEMAHVLQQLGVWNSQRLALLAYNRRDSERTLTAACAKYDATKKAIK